MSSIFLRNGAVTMLRNYLPHSIKFCRKPLNVTQIQHLHLTPCMEKLVSFKLSDIGEGIREVTVKEWFVKVGDTVEQFDDLCEVQSDKASVTITSRYDGKIVKLHHPVDDIAFVGKPLLDFEIEEEYDADSSDSDSSAVAVPNSSTSNESASNSGARKVASDEDVARHITLATPAVRRLAMENKVNLSKVSGTGKQGRVLKGDVLEYLGHVPTGTNIPHPTLVVKDGAMSTKTTQKTVSIGTDRVEPLKGVPKAMFKSMSESLKIPHFAYSDEIDMTKLIDFRGQLRAVASERGVTKLTFMPFCVKAASIALSKYPILNSSLDIENEAVIYKAAHNISVAIDTPYGLVVPNIKNCESKNILEIANDLHDLVERGRKGALTPRDFADGTFSLSNIGVVGGTYTHPCIMPPQVAIGAMGRTKVLPRFNDNDEIFKAFVMHVSWSADHRIIDGVTMAKFSNVWKQHLENPALFLLD